MYDMIVLNSGTGNYVISNGRKYSYFGGNNYLGLACHPEVKEASIRAIEKYGVNFSASRRTTGTADLHLELEKKISEFKGSEDTVVFASGYQGNGILLEILKDKYTTVFMDEFAHSSIRSVVTSGNIEIFCYKHCDAHHLESLLESKRHISPLIITDGVFALTGEIAPLDKIFPMLEKYNARLIVDDAHATGILGENGRGTPEYFRIQTSENIYQSETMSKALGSYGGFISGSKSFIELIRDGSTTYQSSTSLPPPVVAAGIASMNIMNGNPGLRSSVLEKAARLRNEIIELGFETRNNDTPIIPLIFSDEATAKGLSLFLEGRGIIVPFMNYPTGNGLKMIRIAVSAIHKDDQVTELIEGLKEWIRMS